MCVLRNKHHTLPYFQGNKDLLKMEKQLILFVEECLKLRFSGGKNLNFQDICLPL